LAPTSQLTGRFPRRSEFAQERAKLEAIRDKMVDDMEKKGYNPRYLSEIRAADIQKLQMR
jgi:hypothetical protein